VLLTLVILGMLALVPFAWIARSRVVSSELPRIHVFQDMDNQPRFKRQQENPLFADGRAMRTHVQGTVARGLLHEDDHLYRGLVGEAWATRPPMPVTAELIERGRERYEIFCTPCHGLAGYGDGIVSKRAEKLKEGAWVPPSSFHVEPASTREDGHIFNTITHGIRNMPAYGSQIDAHDRWAIVTYVRALQRSQASPVSDVPADVRAGLR
jgi:mono/diheme cytochrome c family protein